LKYDYEHGRKNSKHNWFSIEHYRWNYLVFSPQSAPNGDVSLGLPDTQPLPEGEGWLGRTVGEHKKQVQKINDGIVCRLRFALILIILGFVIQLLAVWE